MNDKIRSNDTTTSTGTITYIQQPNPFPIILNNSPLYFIKKFNFFRKL